MALQLSVCCFSKIQIGFTFLVPANPGNPGKRAVKWVCVCVCVNDIKILNDDLKSIVLVTLKIDADCDMKCGHC